MVMNLMVNGWIKDLKRWWYQHRYEYFFGFGADSEAEMIEAVIGRKPTYLGRAMLYNYQLCIQSLKDIPSTGSDPRSILERAWGSDFKSYTIRPHRGEMVRGSLFRVSGYERRLLDKWELVSEGWQDSRRIYVVTQAGKSVRARTQVLPQGHSHGYTTKGLEYTPWLMPKEDFMRIADLNSERPKLFQP